MSEPLRVDVVFDFVCPWCYIGKRRLEAALEVWKTEHPGDPEPVVRWLPFQLNPDLPAGGMSRQEYLERKHGSAGPSREKQEQVAALGRRLGLAFELDRITVQPNTLDAHRLSGCAQRQKSPLGGRRLSVPPFLLAGRPFRMSSERRPGSASVRTVGTIPMQRAADCRPA